MSTSLAEQFSGSGASDASGERVSRPGRFKAGPMQRRATAATNPDALYEVVIGLARAVDGVRTEIAANTGAVDGLCHDVADIKTMLRGLIERLDGAK